MGNYASTGEDHYRQRRILLPAFGSSESRAQIPVFRQCAREVKPLVLTKNMSSASNSFEVGPGIQESRRIGVI